MNPIEYLDSLQNEVIVAIEVDLYDMVQFHSFNFINKPGVVIAVLYE